MANSAEQAVDERLAHNPEPYLLAIAQGAAIMAFLFSGAWLSKRYNQKLLLAIIYTLPNIIGTIVFLSQ